MLLCVYTRYNLFAHSCLYYYLLSPQYTVLHNLFYCTFYPLFFRIIFNLYLYISSCVVLHILHCPLSGPDPIHISLLIIFCIIEHVTNKQTLNLETQPLEDQGPKIPTLHMKAQDKDKHITLTDEWIKRNHKWRRLLRSGQKNAVISSNSKAFSINTLIIKTHREPCHSHHHLKSHANMDEICVT